MTEVEGQIPCVLAEGIESSLNAIVMIDQEGIIHAFNPTAEKAFGYSRERMIGASIRTFIADNPARNLRLSHKYRPRFTPLTGAEFSTDPTRCQKLLLTFKRSM